MNSPEEGRGEVIVAEALISGSEKEGDSLVSTGSFSLSLGSIVQLLYPSLSLIDILFLALTNSNSVSAPPPHLDVAARTNKTLNACTNNTEEDKPDDDDTDSDEDDLTLQGDLGESSSGFVGSSTLSSVSCDQFKLDIPVSNFPMTVSPLCYQTGLEKLPPSPLVPPCPNQSRSEEEEFSEDSLTNSPSRRSRLTRKTELAQQIDNEDPLANIDSLIPGGEPDKTDIASDSPIPARGLPSSMLEADSLEDLPVPDCRQLMEIQISEISDQSKDIETSQLLSELESLEQEIERLSLRGDGQSRSQWRQPSLDLPTGDLTDNRVTRFSYEDVGSGLPPRRLSTESSCSSEVTRPSSVCSQVTRPSSVTDIDISDPPRPQRASLPSPVPNTRALLARREGKVGDRKMEEHCGAVGVTSMWIPASIRPRPRIKSASPASNTTNKHLQTLSSRDNRAVGKKLQILNILPNKAEGSQSWNGRILLFTQLMLDLAPYIA